MATRADPVPKAEYRVVRPFVRPANLRVQPTPMRTKVRSKGPHANVRAAFVLSVVAVVGGMACRGSGPVSASIAEAVDRGPGTRLALAQSATFEWDRVCLFGPYTPDDEVDAVTGIADAAQRAFDVRSNEAINVLLFIQAGRVIESVAHPRRWDDFGPEVVGKCYSREQAVFVVRRPPLESWGNIGLQKEQ